MKPFVSNEPGKLFLSCLWKKAKISHTSLLHLPQVQLSLSICRGLVQDSHRYQSLLMLKPLIQKEAIQPAAIPVMQNPRTERAACGQPAVHPDVSVLSFIQSICNQNDFFYVAHLDISDSSTITLPMKNVNGLSQHLRTGQRKLDLCQLSQGPLFYLFSAHQLSLVYRT